MVICLLMVNKTIKQAAAAVELVATIKSLAFGKNRWQFCFAAIAVTAKITTTVTKK